MNIDKQIRFWAFLVNESEDGTRIDETQADDYRSIDERVTAIARELDKLEHLKGRTYLRQAFGAIIRNIDVGHSFDVLYRKAMDGDKKAQDEFYDIINPLQNEKYDLGQYNGFGGKTKQEFIKRIFKYLDFFNGNTNRRECEDYVRKENLSEDVELDDKGIAKYTSEFHYAFMSDGKFINPILSLQKAVGSDIRDCPWYCSDDDSQEELDWAMRVKKLLGDWALGGFTNVKIVKVRFSSQDYTDAFKNDRPFKFEIVDDNIA